MDNELAPKVPEFEFEGKTYKLNRLGLLEVIDLQRLFADKRELLINIFSKRSTLIADLTRKHKQEIKKNKAFKIEDTPEFERFTYDMAMDIIREITVVRDPLPGEEPGTLPIPNELGNILTRVIGMPWTDFINPNIVPLPMLSMIAHALVAHPDLRAAIKNWQEGSLSATSQQDEMMNSLDTSTPSESATA